MYIWPMQYYGKIPKEQSEVSKSVCVRERKCECVYLGECMSVCITECVCEREKV
jgi:hypothetical protein